MYKNYGDVNFYEHGVLADTDNNGEVSLIRCEPYSEDDNLFQFDELTVDINDDWLDKNAVMDFAGITKDTFDPVQYAIACTDYYGWENFGAGSYPSLYDWRQMKKKEIKDILSYCDIDPSVQW